MNKNNKFKKRTERQKEKAKESVLECERFFSETYIWSLCCIYLDMCSLIIFLSVSAGESWVYGVRCLLEVWQESVIGQWLFPLMCSSLVFRQVSAGWQLSDMSVVLATGQKVPVVFGTGWQTQTVALDTGQHVSVVLGTRWQTSDTSIALAAGQKVSVVLCTGWQTSEASVALGTGRHVSVVLEQDDKSQTCQQHFTWHKPAHCLAVRYHSSSISESGIKQGKLTFNGNVLPYDLRACSWWWNYDNVRIGHVHYSYTLCRRSTAR